jgi:hypothetical protein
MSVSHSFDLLLPACLHSLTPHGESNHHPLPYSSINHQSALLPLLITLHYRYLYAEARLALYFCQDYWEQYQAAVAAENKREQHRLLLSVANSPKPKHLTSFLLRLKAFYKKSSIIDKPMHVDERADMELMQFVSERMQDMQAEADKLIEAKRVTKYATVQYLENKFSGKTFVCPKCDRPTERHLEYCANCGKKQIWM